MATNAAEIDRLVAEVQRAAEARKNGEARPGDLIEATRKLHIAAEGPVEAVSRIRNQPVQNVCLLMASEMGLIQIITAMKGQPITAAELAKQTKWDEFLIARVMRVLTAMDICDEVGVATYRANAMSDVTSVAGQEAGNKVIAEMVFNTGAKIVEYMRQGQYHQFPQDDSQRDIFNYAYGMPIWEVLRTNSELKDDYDNFMAGRRRAVSEYWFDVYPAAAELANGLKTGPDDILLIDIGGGSGHDISLFHKRFPNLPGRRILQDLPETIKRAKGSLPQGIETMEYDFFTPQPVQGARIYFFRNICHDWSDHRTREILSNTVKSMDKDYSRVVIEDWILPDTGAPLMPVVGDMLMMLVASGIERTVSQWQKLLDDVGLEIVKMWSVGNYRQAVIEAKAKQN